MTLTKKLFLPAAVAMAGFIGVTGASVVSNVAASADTATTASATTTTDTKAAVDRTTGGHTANGKTETVLTGDDATKATAAALVAVPGATVQRAETDAEGAAYEVHLKKADGTMVTVKLDSSFKVTSTEAGMR